MKSRPKHVNIMIVLVLSILLPIIIELTSMWLWKGNVVVDSLVFTGFEYVEPFSPDKTLKNNQYLIGDSLYTLIQDSVDYEIYIDNNCIFKDTLYYSLDSESQDTVAFNGWYSSCRNSCWIRPGKHSITTKSTKLNVSYRHTFRCLALMVIYVDSSREPPYFTIRKSFIPLRRTMM